MFLFTINEKIVKSGFTKQILEDVIIVALTLSRKRGYWSMLFHLHNLVGRHTYIKSTKLCDNITLN